MNDTIQTYNVAEILANLPHLDLTRGVKGEDAAAAFPMQAPFDAGGLFIGGFTGLSPWERHPDADELLYAVDGEVELTILTDDGTRRGLLRQGEACVVPKGLWHRQFAAKAVKLLTISSGTDISMADDPRDTPTSR